MVSTSLVADGCVGEGVLWVVVEPVYCPPVASWHEMPVGVYGNLNTMMSELFLGVGQRFAVLDEQRGKGMPPVVEADVT